MTEEEIKKAWEELMQNRLENIKVSDDRIQRVGAVGISTYHNNRESITFEQFIGYLSKEHPKVYSTFKNMDRFKEDIEKWENSPKKGLEVSRDI